MSKTIDWIAGDTFGLQIPAHIDALREGGTSFLTEAFRKAVAIDESNSVTGITRFEECPGGGTGAKLYLSLEYEKPAPGLPTDLFVKFSRAFGNDMRDRQKIQMESEVWLALLSRVPEFPVSVPKCMFADYHRETRTGRRTCSRLFWQPGRIQSVKPGGRAPAPDCPPNLPVRSVAVSGSRASPLSPAPIGGADIFAVYN